MLNQTQIDDLFYFAAVHDGQTGRQWATQQAEDLLAAIERQDPQVWRMGGAPDLVAALGHRTVWNFFNVSI